MHKNKKVLGEKFAMNFIELGKKIYDLNNPRELHRFTVFIARCILNPKRINRLEEFFSRTENFKYISERFPFVYEQVTRAFFYYKSKSYERVNTRFREIGTLLRFFISKYG